MAINQRYELIELIRDDDGIRSARGQDLTSGQVVEVHLFQNGHSNESKALLRKIVAMPRGGTSALLDFGEEQGTPYVVTRPLGGVFREWVTNESRRAQGFGPPPSAMPPYPAQTAPPAPAPVQQQQPMGQRDPFSHMFEPPVAAQPGMQGGTQMFQSLPQPQQQQYAPPPPQQQSPQVTQQQPQYAPPPQTQQAPPPQQAGALPPLPPKQQSMGAVTVEFHRLFADEQDVATMRATAPVVPPHQPQQAAPQDPNAPPAPKPGEFTLMFGAPRPKIEFEGPPAAAAPAPAPVAFDLSLKPAAPTAPVQPQPSAPPPVQQQPQTSPAFSAPVFQQQQPPPPAAAPTPPPPQQSVGEFTQMFQQPVPPPPPQASSPKPASPPPPPVAQQPPPAGPQGGEFTQMFQAPDRPPAATPVAPPPAPPPPNAAGGEFTQMFQAPNAPPSQAPAAGEYTRQFTPFQQAPPTPQPPPAKPMSSAPAPPPMPMGAPNPNRMTVVDMPSIPASAFDPVRPAGGPPPQQQQQPQPPRPPQPVPPSGVTVEFNRLFEEPKSPGAQPSHQATADFAKKFGLDQNPPPAQAQQPQYPQPPPPAAGQQPRPGQSGVTVEFNRLFDSSTGDSRTMQNQAPQQQANQPPPGQGPGEFTRMFQSGGGAAGQPAQPRPGPKPGGGYVTAKEGESTQMFQAPTRQPPPMAPRQQPPPPPQMQQPPQSGGPAGGEFTQMFQRNQGGALPSSGAPAGEFTRQFMNPMANPGPTPDYQMPPMAQQPLGPAPPQKVNEFEELFGGVKAQPRPAPPGPGFGGQTNAGGAGGLSATSQFSASPSGSTPAPSAAPMSAPLAPAMGGGSYTQFMKAPGPAEPFGLGMQQPAQKGPQAPAPLVAKKGVPPIVWIAGGLIIFLIIAVVIVFAFMKK